MQSVNPCVGFREGKERQSWKWKAFSVEIISLPDLLKCRIKGSLLIPVEVKM